MFKYSKAALVLFVLLGVCHAHGDLAWSKIDLLPGLAPDGSPTQAKYGYPTEIFSASAVYLQATGRLTVTINTNLPETGFGGSGWRDSYQAGKVLRPGDLYVAYDVDGNYWDPDKIFAVGLTDHTGNVVSQAYNDDANWGSVLKGHIYSTPSDSLTDWATGTYEGYDHSIPSGLPADADSSGVSVVENGLKARKYDTDLNYVNTYPTVLKAPESDLGLAAVAWTLNPASSLENMIGKYDITIDLDPADLGLELSEYRNLSFFWTMECGNDGVLLTGPVGQVIPEPLTVLLFGTIAAGAAGFTSRRKK